MRSAVRSIIIAGLAAVLIGGLATSASAIDVPSCRISGYVFLDGPTSSAAPYDRANGMWDQTDPGFAGVQMRVRLHYLNSNLEPQVLETNYHSGKPKATTDANGYYQIDVDTFDYLKNKLGYFQPIAYEVYVYDEGSNALGFRPNVPTNLVSTTGHDSEVGALITKHSSDANKFVYGGVIFPVGGEVFNWLEGAFPNYRAFMGPEWPEPPSDWSAFELTEYQRKLFGFPNLGLPLGPNWRAHVDFGFATEDQVIYPKAKIGDYVWEDLNRDGLQDSNEPGVEGVTVNLKDQAGNVIKSMLTDVDGYYLFKDLDQGTYSVSFVLPAGYAWTLQDQGANDNLDSDVDANGDAIQTFLAWAETDLSWDAGLVTLPAAIGDYVWADLNEDGLQDDGEPGVKDVTVNLLDADGDIIDTMLTDANGLYLFDDLAPGVYSVNFVLPPWVGWTTQDAGSDDADDSDVDENGNTIQTTLVAGETDLTWDAGVVALKAAIGDYVWEDLDKDGVQDADEPGVEGVTVNLKDSSGTVIDTMLTDADGYYLFDNLNAGWYSVSFVLPSGFGWTTQDAGGDDAADSDADANGDAIQTPLLPGQTDLTWDAGLVRLLCAIGDYVWEDLNKDGVQDDDEPGVEGVTVNLKDAGGNVINTMQTGADGKYLFTGLAAGTYSVSFVLPSGYNWTTQDAGGDDAADSDADASGNAIQTALVGGETDLTWDAGIVKAGDEITVVKTHKKIGGCGTGYQLGDTVEFTVTVTANLSAPRDVEVRDYLDSCLQFISASNGGVWVSTGRYVSWAITLPAGSSTTALTLRAKITKAPVGDNGQPASGEWIISNEVSFQVWDQLYASAEGQYVPTSGAAASDYGVKFASGTGQGVYKMTCHPYPKLLTNQAYVGDREPPTDKITVKKSGAELAGNCHTIGFWKNNIRKAIQGSTCGIQVSKAQLLTWLAAVRAFHLANPYQNLIPASPASAMLQGAYSVLDYNGSDMAKKLLKQLLACELNLVSGDYAMNDTAAHSAFCAAAEDALNTTGANLGAFHDTADMINNLGNTSSGTNIVVGDRIVFTITVEAELSEARSVEVRDYIDSCLSVESISDGGVYVSTGRYVKWVVDLPAGTSAKKLTFVAKITKLPVGDNGSCPSTEWVLSNEVALDVYSSSYASADGVVEFTCYTPPVKKTLKNVACAKLGEPGTPPPPPPPPSCDPKVTICKSVDKTEVLVGECLVYGIKVTVQNGPVTVTVSDALPSGVRYVSSTPSGQYSNGAVSWKNVTLQTGTHYFLIKVCVKDGKCSDEVGATTDTAKGGVQFTCGSGGGKKKTYVCTLCNVAKVKVGCKTITSNKVSTKVYKYTSSGWGC